MESAEAALNNYRLEHGSVDLPSETQVVLQRIVSIETQLSELKGNRQALTQKFKPRHPRIAALDMQIGNLKGQLKTLESKVKNLPDTQQEIMRLSRDVEVNTQFYTFLLNRATAAPIFPVDRCCSRPKKCVWQRGSGSVV